MLPNGLSTQVSSYSEQISDSPKTQVKSRAPHTENETKGVN